MAVEYATLADVLAIHAEILQRSAEDVPAVDTGCVDAAIAMPRQGFAGVEAYPTIAEKAAAYLFHLAKKHCFGQGNKRTAAFTAEWFLAQNGLELGGEHFRAGQLARLTIDLVTGRCELAAAAKWFARRIVPAGG